MTDGLSAYRRAAVSTASPTGLITLLLRRCLQELDAASGLLEADGDGESARPHMRLAQEILSQLRSSLRHDIGEALPAQLDALYDFSYWRIVEAYSRLDPQPCSEAADTLRPLLAAWDAAFHD